MAFEVVAQLRKGQGRGASRRLRHTGKVPGIIYGGKKPAVNIELDVDRGFLAPVDNPGHLPGVAQAAARTPPLPLAQLRDDFECHVDSPRLRRRPRPGATVEKSIR